jgi:hypothetical protein
LETCAARWDGTVTRVSKDKETTTMRQNID